MKSFNFKKVAIIALDVILVLILAGCVFLGFLGVNKTAEAKGGVEVQIALDENYHDSKERATAQKDITKIFTDNGYKVTEVKRLIDSNVYNTLVFCIDGDSAMAETLALETTGSIYSLVKTYLETENPGFVFDNEADIEEFRVDYVGGSFSSKILAKTAISLAIIFVVAVIYFAIRFGIASALTSFIATILEFALFNSIVIITRIPLDGNFYLVMFAVLIFSILASLIYNGFFRSAIKGAEEKPLEDHSKDISLKVGKIFGGLTIAVVFALLIAIIAVPSTIKLILAQIALGTLITGAVAVLVRPALRLWLGSIKKEKKSGYKGHAKQKDTKQED